MTVTKSKNKIAPPLKKRKNQVGPDGERVEPTARLLDLSVPVDCSRELSSFFYCNEDITLSLHMSCGRCFTAGSFIMTVGHA